MLTRLRSDFADTPRQFWLMFFGMMFSTIGTTMIWPFLMIYASETLSLPLVTVASLMTINAGTGLVSAILAGPVIDRVGRKWAMVVGLLGAGMGYFLLSRANTYAAFALILGSSGMFGPLYNVGTDAMLADMIPMDKRADAYALLRMAHNVGVAAGPALGGFVLARSYRFGMYGAGAGLIVYGLALLFFARETLPEGVAVEKSNVLGQLRGYWTALQDRAFMGLVGAFTLLHMTASMIWVLLSVYLKTQFGISEQVYGWLPTTNALMVVFFQVLVTRKMKKYPDVQVMTWGAVFYVFAPLTIALSNSFWGFWLGMVIMTVGELVVVPRSSAYAANLAPVDKRGRYMSLYGLTWNVAAGISPVLGGLASDQIGPRAPWTFSAVIGLLAVLAFRRLKKYQASKDAAIS
ncbi:MAG: MFS transporter [Porticoccaceae bacterium]|nr:MFS transporter [Porticoccaceae bacterium]